MERIVPLVGVIMGSKSDWATMKGCCEVLEQLGVPHEARVVSAHRTPDLLFEYCETAADRGLRVIIAGAGGAAHLPGMAASKTWLRNTRNACRRFRVLANGRKSACRRQAVE